MKKLVAGIVGCGNISRFHFPGLEKADVEVAWVCDLNEDTARPWAERFGSRFTKDYREVIADPAVDVVDVTTISRVHKEICLAAIDAGKAVICEKTLAENADDSLEIVSAAEAAGTIFYTSYMKRFIPVVQKAKELLPSLGTLLSTHIRAYQCWGDIWDTAPDKGFFWTPPGDASGVRKNYGGGILVCGGSHILDLVHFFLGRPYRVFAHMHTPEGRDYDMQAACLMETENGIVHYEALAHSLNKIGYLHDGWDERIEIFGTKGRIEILSAQWDQVEHKASRMLHYDNETGETAEYDLGAVSPFEPAIAFFCDNIRRGEQGAQSRLTGYEVDEMIAHIEKSAAEGKSIDVRWRA